MAGFRKPGPLGRDGHTDDIHDGTSNLQASPLAGSLCATSHHQRPQRSAFARPIIPPQRATRPPSLPVLREGSRGHQVGNLQQLLNLRLDPSPQLDVDQIFGPLTKQAVLTFQRAASVGVDGIVGNLTWYNLLKGDKFAAPQTAGASLPSAGASSLSKAASPPAQSLVATSVLGWPIKDKFIEALKLTPHHLTGEAREQFLGLLTPTQLAIMGGSLVALAVSHVFGVGEVVDLVMGAVGVVFLGKAAIDVAKDFGDFLSLTVNAETEKDLDNAAAHLARVVVVIGVTALTAWLTKKVASKLRRPPKGGGTGGTSEPPVSEETAPAKKATSKPKAPNKVPSADAEQIAKGHAWSKHQGEFPEFSTKEEFAQHIDEIMTNPSDSKTLARGRKAFWDDRTKTVVIRDPNSPDLGTAFKPTNGKAYFDNLK